MELKLLRSTQDILELITEKTRKPFSFIKKPDLPTLGSIKIARKSMTSHIIYYRDENNGILDHLIAHECGHIYRLWGVPPEDRKMVSSRYENKRLAMDQIAYELLKLSKIIPVEKLNKVSDMWFSAMITQVTNIPVDMRIEKWIFDDYPELRKSQEVSIDRQMKEGAAVLSKRIQDLTPKKIYDASNHTNCSFAIAMEKLLRKKYTAPYRNTPFIDLGIELADLVIKSDDKGFNQDIQIIEQWTVMLGLKGWYEWIDFEDIPLNYLESP
jgi:hypothetical protein